jgi:mycothiol system anti-sigma-R factor
MNCNRVREVLFLAIDDETGHEWLIMAREHLSECPGCARRLDYTRRLIGLVRRHCARAAAPPTLRERILTQLVREGLRRDPAP